MNGGHLLRTWPVAVSLYGESVPVAGFAGVRMSLGAARLFAWHLFMRVAAT